MNAAALVEGHPASSISYAKEIKMTGLLGLGIGFSQLAQVLIGMTDTVMMARLGPVPLAAGALVNSMVLMLFLFCMGVLQATAPLMGTALGEGHERDIPTILKAGNRIAIAFSLVVAIYASLLGYFFSLTGQQPEVISIGSRFALWLIPGIWASLMIVMLRVYLTTMNDMALLGLVSLLGVLVNGFADYALMFGKFGLPQMGITGCAISTSMTNVFMYLCLHLSLRRRRGLTGKVYSESAAMPSRLLYKSIFSLGIPIGFAILSEYVVLAAAGLIFGRIGVDTLAAFSICLQWLGVFYMLPVGLSQAATTRVAIAIGLKNTSNVRCVTLTSLGLVTAYGILAWLILALFSSPLVNFVLHKDISTEIIIARANAYMFWTGALLFVSGLVVVSAGVMRGFRDTRTPMLLIFLFYWVGSLGLSWLLSLFYGDRGVWVGIVAGFTATQLGLSLALRDKLRKLHNLFGKIREEDEQMLGLGRE